MIFKDLFMYRYLLAFIFTFGWITDTSFALPVRQKEIIEILIVEGSFEKALSAIESIRDTLPDDSDLLLLKGICCYKLEAHKTQAAPILLNALALSKTKHDDIDITYHLAQAYIACSDYENACKNYEHLQKIVPRKFSNLHQKIESQIALCHSRLSSLPADTLTPGKADFPQPATNSARTFPEYTESDTLRKHYTIQLCSMSFPLSDSFFKGQYGVKLIRMGDIYRYIYNIYPSIEEARTALPTIRKIYPDAFIREFDEEKLGQAVDLNMDRIK